jgi:hypothetical protein
MLGEVYLFGARARTASSSWHSMKPAATFQINLQQPAETDREKVKAIFKMDHRKHFLQNF